MSTNNWLFVSDVDDTLLGDNAALARLMAELATRPFLTVAYNS
ncbi:MAG: haloacid dehalogenase, partial [Anaerolineae bacterium]|nr:haloacid dehalogenase [Anaerolineae bacterium]